MYCVGLIGTIASGKSTVTAVLQALGVKVISADVIAKQLTEPGQVALASIKNHFGPQILTSDGQLNRPALRALIFNQPQERHWLEELLHPLIRQRILQDVQATEAPYCVIEIPLLKDRKTYPYLKRILWVKSDNKQQIERLIHRDNLSLKQAQQILACQKEQTNHEELADDILENEGTLAELTKKIKNFHQQYLQLAQQTR